MYRAAATALALAVLNLIAPAVGAAVTASGLSLEGLMEGLAQVKSASGQFVERKYLRILTEPLEFRGTLSYSAPGRLEKHTLKPKPESLVLEQDRLTIEDKARNQRRVLVLQEHPVLWAFVESIRSTLAGDLKSLNRFYHVSLEGDERRWHLLMKPRDARMQTVVSEIRVTGSGHSVRVVEVHEAGGDHSVMTITEDKR